MIDIFNKFIVIISIFLSIAVFVFLLYNIIIYSKNEYTIKPSGSSGSRIVKTFGKTATRIAKASVKTATVFMKTAVKGIAYWGYFSNEPSTVQESNTFLDTNLKENYLNRSRVKEGEYFLYKLIASRNIKKGEEITWCYGSLYSRNYDTSCDEK